MICCLVTTGGSTRHDYTILIFNYRWRLLPRHVFPLISRKPMTMHETIATLWRNGGFWVRTWRVIFGHFWLAFLLRRQDEDSMLNGDKWDLFWLVNYSMRTVSTSFVSNGQSIEWFSAVPTFPNTPSNDLCSRLFYSWQLWGNNQ
jgi:hypothetical protein